MTEMEWLECTDAGQMLRWLVDQGESGFKLRQFAAACTDGQQARYDSPYPLDYGTGSDGRWYLTLVNSYDHDDIWHEAVEPATALSCLRDVLGNPFRPVAVDPAWLAWNDGVLCKLAQAAYDRQLPAGTLDPSRLAVLADALEEAGCTDADLLG